MSLLASADPNVAQIPQSHFVYLELVRQLGTRASRSCCSARCSPAGAWPTRSRRPAPRPSPTSAPACAAAADAQAGFVLEGQKFYCTGSLLAHWLTVLAKDQDGRTQVAIVSPDAEGVSIVDDWTGMGQRTTASGTVQARARACARARW